MSEVLALFELFMELEEMGVSGMATDGERLFLWPSTRLSLRMRSEVRRRKKEIIEDSNIPRIGPGPVLAIGDVEVL